MSEFDYSDFAEADDVNLLTTISNTADRAKAIESELEALEAKMKALRSEALYILDSALPELMSRAKLADFTTQNGVKIKVDDVYRANLPKEDLDKRAAGLAWLTENGHGAVIKTEVKTEFGMGENEAAVALYERLQGQNAGVTSMASTVHHSTLTSLVRELAEKGEFVPWDILGAEVRKTAKIGASKKRQLGA